MVDVLLELPGPEPRTVKLSSPDKVLWPDAPGGAVTKRGLADYLIAVSEPFLRLNGDRPMTLQRFPDGVDGEEFFSKRPPRGAPSFLRTVTCTYPSRRRHDQLVFDEPAALAWAAQMGTITFHPWPVRTSNLDNPDEFLKPNMFAKVSIGTGKGEPRLVVPSEAVIRTGSQDRLVLALGDGNFKSVAVTLGPQFGDKVAIQEGVEAGDSIVSSAQFLLDSESAIDSDFQRMTAVRPMQVWTQGQVQNIDLAGRTLGISHQPIPEWQWPAMEMDFTVADGVDISQLKPDQTLHLQVEQEGDEYRIIQIHVEDKPAADEPMKEAKGEMPGMEGMDHSQHQMGDKS